MKRQNNVANTLKAPSAHRRDLGTKIRLMASLFNVCDAHVDSRAWNADCTNAVSGGTEGQLRSELGTRCVVGLILRVYPFRHSH